MDFEERVRAKRDEKAAEAARRNAPPSVPPLFDEVTQGVNEILARFRFEHSFRTVIGVNPKLDVSDAGTMPEPTRSLSFTSKGADDLFGRDHLDGDGSMERTFIVVVSPGSAQAPITVRVTDDLQGDSRTSFVSVENALETLENEIVEFCAHILEASEPSRPKGP